MTLLAVIARGYKLAMSKDPMTGTMRAERLLF
jgi:hypothetical protein